MNRNHLRIKVFAVMTAAALTVLTLAGCTYRIPTVGNFAATIGQPNLAEQATVLNSKGGGLPYTDENYGEIGVTFDEERVLNAVAVSERSKSIEEIEIRVKTDGVWTKIYRQDTVGSLRYCVFSTVKTTELEIRFRSPGEFTVAELGIFYVPKTEREFHAVSFLDAVEIADFAKFDRNFGIDGFTAVTDVVLCGGAEFRSDGTLSIANEYAAAIENLKQIERQLNRRFTIFCDFQPSESEFATGNFDSSATQYVRAMKMNRARFAEELNRFLIDTATDGISFDWQFPKTNGDWNAYSDFIVALRAAIEPGRKITATVGGSNASFHRAAIDAIDLVQVATERVGDAGFERFILDAEKLVALGYDEKKLCMGIPFYAEGTGDAAAETFAYRGEAENLGGDYNVISNPLPLADGKIYERPRVYNGYGTVRDKTAYAYDAGFGGVAFFCHVYDCRYDLTVGEKPVSLLKAAADAMIFRRNV